MWFVSSRREALGVSHSSALLIDGRRENMLMRADTHLCMIIAGAKLTSGFPDDSGGQVQAQV